MEAWKKRLREPSEANQLGARTVAIATFNDGKFIGPHVSYPVNQWRALARLLIDPIPRPFPTTRSGAPRAGSWP
jgi:hypothetical protein